MSTKQVETGKFWLQTLLMIVAALLELHNIYEETLANSFLEKKRKENIPRYPQNRWSNKSNEALINWKISSLVFTRGGSQRSVIISHSYSHASYRNKGRLYFQIPNHN